VFHWLTLRHCAPQQRLDVRAADAHIAPAKGDVVRFVRMGPHWPFDRKTCQEPKMSETVEQVTAASTAAFKEGYEKLQAAAAEMTSHSKANLDALIAAAQTSGKGLEEATSVSVAYAKAASEKAMETAKSLGAVKSLQEAVEIQADYAKSALETYFAEFNKVSDILLTATKEATKPISERTSAVVQAMQAAR
jgi:phasin family protein